MDEVGEGAAQVKVKKEYQERRQKHKKETYTRWRTVCAGGGWIEETQSGAPVTLWTSESVCLPFVTQTHSPMHTHSLHRQAKTNSGLGCYGDIPPER